MSDACDSGCEKPMQVVPTDGKSMHAIRDVETTLDGLADCRE
jgi:hypothetical protein